MRYRALGSTGLSISEIGFGAWGIGGGAGGDASYGRTDDARSLAALHAALDAGVNFFDTSDLYGRGHSERLLGAAFRGRRDQVVIATKGGMLNPAGEQDFGAGHLRRALEGSLARLGTDRVDLYQLHSPPLEQVEGNQELRRLLEDLVTEGKVRATGFSARSPQEALAAVERLGFRSVQVNLNLLDWRALDCGLPQRCRELGAGIIARTPLCFGFLTGRYSIHDVRDPNDHRAQWPAEQLQRWIDAAPLFDRVIAAGAPQSVGQKALRFCLSCAEVAAVIPGMLTPEQVAENVGASALGGLPEAELAAAERVYRENVFMVGRRAA